MAFIRRLWSRIRGNGELWVLTKHSLLTGTTTAIALLVRFLLLRFCRGSHVIGLPGSEITVEINDHTAYMTYYILSVVMMYLFRWFTAKGVRVRSFLPRMLAFGALYTVSMLIGNSLLTVFLGWGINSELAFWLTCPVTFVINYLGNRLIVFFDSDSRLVSEINSHNSNDNLLNEGTDTDGGQEN